MKVKQKGVIGLIAILAWILGASAVVAGEVNGKGEEIPGGENGKSACSFSGQQDDPEEDEGFFRGDRVQNWGQIPKAARLILATLGLHPGQACNPNKSQGEPS